MKKYLILILFIVLLISCSKSPIEPEPIDLIFRVVSCNETPINKIPDEAIHPLKIELFQYKKGEKLKGSILISLMGHYDSNAKFSTLNKIYFPIPDTGIDLILNNLIITQAKLIGEYYWTINKEIRNSFIAISINN